MVGGDWSVSRVLAFEPVDERPVANVPGRLPGIRHERVDRPVQLPRLDRHVPFVRRRPCQRRHVHDPGHVRQVLLHGLPPFGRPAAAGRHSGQVAVRVAHDDDLVLFVGTGAGLGGREDPRPRHPLGHHRAILSELVGDRRRRCVGRQRVAGRPHKVAHVGGSIGGRFVGAPVQDHHVVRPEPLFAQFVLGKGVGRQRSQSGHRPFPRRVFGVEPSTRVPLRPPLGPTGELVGGQALHLKDGRLLQRREPRLAGIGPRSVLCIEQTVDQVVGVGVAVGGVLGKDKSGQGAVVGVGRVPVIGEHLRHLTRDRFAPLGVQGDAIQAVVRPVGEDPRVAAHLGVDHIDVDLVACRRVDFRDPPSERVVRFGGERVPDVQVRRLHLDGVEVGRLGVQPFLALHLAQQVGRLVASIRNRADKLGVAVP